MEHVSFELAVTVDTVIPFRDGGCSSSSHRIPHSCYCKYSSALYLSSRRAYKCPHAKEGSLVRETKPTCSNHMAMHMHANPLSLFMTNAPRSASGAGAQRSSFHDTMTSPCLYPAKPRYVSRTDAGWIAPRRTTFTAKWKGTPSLSRRPPRTIDDSKPCFPQLPPPKIRIASLNIRLLSRGEKWAGERRLVAQKSVRAWKDVLEFCVDKAGWNDDPIYH